MDIVDPSKRMAETHRRCESVKTDRSLPFTNAIADGENGRVPDPEVLMDCLRDGGSGHAVLPISVSASGQ